MYRVSPVAKYIPEIEGLRYTCKPNEPGPLFRLEQRVSRSRALQLYLVSDHAHTLPLGWLGLLGYITSSARQGVCLHEGSTSFVSAFALQAADCRHQEAFAGSENPENGSRTQRLPWTTFHLSCMRLEIAVVCALLERSPL